VRELGCGAGGDAAVGAAARQARRPRTRRTAGCALGRAAHDRGDRATCRSPGYRQGTSRRPDRARATLTGLTPSLPRAPHDAAPVGGGETHVAARTNIGRRWLNSVEAKAMVQRRNW